MSIFGYLWENWETLATEAKILSFNSDQEPFIEKNRVFTSEQPHIIIGSVFELRPISTRLMQMLKGFSISLQVERSNLAPRKRGVYIHKSAQVTVIERTYSGISTYCLTGWSEKLEDLVNLVKLFMAGRISPFIDWSQEQIEELPAPVGSADEIRVKILELKRQLWVMERGF